MLSLRKQEDIMDWKFTKFRLFIPISLFLLLSIGVKVQQADTVVGRGVDTFNQYAGDLLDLPAQSAKQILIVNDEIKVYE